MAADGNMPDMRVIEEGFRKAALSAASAVLTQLLNSIPETVPVCPCCGKPMRNIGKRSKKIVSLLGDGEISRNYYGCKSCHKYAAPKDAVFGIEDTMFTRR
jgi:transposase-like protein